MVIRKLVRIEEEGRLTLPVEVRERFAFKTGDVVAVTETDEGVMITSRHDLVREALDEIGLALRESNASLDEMIESGRDIRGDIVRERYGLDISESHDSGLR